MWKQLAAAAALAAGVTSFPVVAWAGPAPHATSSANPNAHFLRSCAPTTSAATAFCDAVLNTAAKPSKPGPGPTGANPAGYHPADLQSAYNVPSSTATPTVAIVDAYNDPYAASDLATYRAQFGLPACGSGCFTQVNQNGGTSLPRNNAGWSQEISLDLDMVSAICPTCHILLVEASSASYANLGTAVDTAAGWPGVVAISNSYGGSDSSSDSSYDAYYDHPGKAVTVSSGDNAYGVEYPASSPYVTAVGGTSLTKDASTARGWTETAWSSAGSGCSAYEPQPSWQSSVSNISSVCGGRAVADVSADADPNTGVSVYDSYAYQGYKGWLVFGGTSVASPIIASMYALAGNTSGIDNGSYPYSHTSSLNDVTSGSNGSCGNDLCNAVTGWDGPTGLGTPNGTGAF